MFNAVKSSALALVTIGIAVLIVSNVQALLPGLLPRVAPEREVAEAQTPPPTPARPVSVLVLVDAQINPAQAVILSVGGRSAPFVAGAATFALADIAGATSLTLEAEGGEQMAIRLSTPVSGEADLQIRLADYSLEVTEGGRTIGSAPRGPQIMEQAAVVRTAATQAREALTSAETSLAARIKGTLSYSKIRNAANGAIAKLETYGATPPRDSAVGAYYAAILDDVISSCYRPIASLAAEYAGKASDIVSLRRRLDAIVSRAGIRQAGQTSFDVYAAQREAEAQTAPVYAQINEAFALMRSNFYTTYGFGGSGACYHQSVVRIDDLLGRLPPVPAPGVEAPSPAP
jgi:hypothetical protein